MATHRSIKRVKSRDGLESLNSRISATTIRLRFRSVSVPIPSELWGATSLAISLCRQPQRLSRVMSRAISGGILPPLDEVSMEYPKTIADALEYKPKLAAMDDALAFLFAALTCLGVYAISAPTAFSPTYSACMCVLCGLLVFGFRAWRLERAYKTLQRSEKALAGPGALFKQVKGTHIHYTRDVKLSSNSVDSTTSNKLAVHCLHGFGASSYSWSFIAQPLAHAIQGLVTAHDMPGFGLSQRPSSPKYYSLRFNGVAAREIMEYEIQRLSLLDQKNQQQPPKRVLVGHSMGGSAAAEAVIQNPKGIAALVLVAPAIVALWMGPPKEARSDPVILAEAFVEEFAGAQDPLGAVVPEPESPQATEKASSSSFTRRLTTKVMLPVRITVALIQAVIAQLIKLIVIALSPLLIVLLRRLVRSRNFWERGLAAAWLDKSRVTAEYIDYYRLPQLVKGWERGMLRFMAARFSEKRNLVHALQDVVSGNGHLSQAEKLALVCEQHNIKVLIVHGTADVLVPVANSRRLASLLPNARLVECSAGHMPHEELPQLFMDEVSAFLKEI